MKKHIVMAIVATFAFLALSGCGILESMQDNPETARITTQYATAKVIDGDPDRADRVADIAKKARETVGKDAVSTVSALDAYVRSKIDWNSLAPEDNMLIDAVLTRAAERLEEEIGSGALDADERVQLDTFLGWIEDVAERGVQE